MNKQILITLVFAALLLTTCTGKDAGNVEADSESKFLGSWQGLIEVGGQKIPTVVHISLNDNKVLEAQIDSPNQGAFGIPVAKTKVKSAKLNLTVAAVAATYEGNLTESGNIEGIWKQGGGSFTLNLERLTAKPDYSKPQDPKEPYPYHNLDLTFRNESADISLAGSFTYPDDGDAVTAVVLISGSGAQDRDEAIMGHRPFLVLSDALTRNGNAVLRFDDRGFGQSEGDHLAATTLDFAGDVAAAVAYLRSQTYCTIKKIGLIGHSEGGLIAPLVALEDPGIDFIVLLAGPGISGREVLLSQSRAIMKAQGLNQTVIENAARINAEIYEIVETFGEKAGDELTNKLPSYGLSAEQIAAAIAEVTTPWFRFFLTYDPAAALSQLTIPVLAMNGSLDLQILPDENLEAIGKALEKAGNSNFSLKRFEGLNHLFQPAKTGDISEYATIQTTFDEAAMAYLVDWVGKQ